MGFIKIPLSTLLTLHCIICCIQITTAIHHILLHKKFRILHAQFVKIQRSMVVLKGVEQAFLGSFWLNLTCICHERSKACRWCDIKYWWWGSLLQPPSPPHKCGCSYTHCLHYFTNEKSVQVPSAYAACIVYCVLSSNCYSDLFY